MRVAESGKRILVIYPQHVVDSTQQSVCPFLSWASKLDAIFWVQAGPISLYSFLCIAAACSSTDDRSSIATVSGGRHACRWFSMTAMNLGVGHRRPQASSRGFDGRWPRNISFFGTKHLPCPFSFRSVSLDHPSSTIPQYRRHVTLDRIIVPRKRKRTVGGRNRNNNQFWQRPIPTSQPLFCVHTSPYHIGYHTSHII